MISALAAGSPYKAIAATLGISDSSVDTYRVRAFEKLGAANLVDAALALRAILRREARERRNMSGISDPEPCSLPGVALAPGCTVAADGHR